MISFSYSGDGRGDEHGNELRPTLRPEAREAHAHPVMRDVYARYDPLRLLSPLDQTSPTPSDSILVVLSEIHSWRAALFLVHGNNSCATRRGKKRGRKRKKNIGRARLSCFMVSSKRESHLQVHLPSDGCFVARSVAKRVRTVS